MHVNFLIHDSMEKRPSSGRPPGGGGASSIKLPPIGRPKSAAKHVPRTVTCQFCGLSYSHSGNLSKHVRSVSQRYRTSKCALRSNLSDSHCVHADSQIKTAHKDHRPHKCELCNLTFHYPDGLRRHHNSCHSATGAETRPFKCGVCGASFKHRHNLSKHENAAHKKR